jgi:hypothetical protein
MGVIRRWWNFGKEHPLQASLICMFLYVAIAWGGERGGKGPSVTRKGIKWKSVSVTPQGISAEWEAEDDRVSADAEYIIEYRKKWTMLGDTVVERPEDMEWKEFGRTKDRKFAKECWLLVSTYDIRVRTVVQEGVTE